MTNEENGIDRILFFFFETFVEFSVTFRRARPLDRVSCPYLVVVYGQKQRQSITAGVSFLKRSWEGRDGGGYRFLRTFRRRRVTCCRRRRRNGRRKPYRVAEVNCAKRPGLDAIITVRIRNVTSPVHIYIHISRGTKRILLF